MGTIRAAVPAVSGGLDPRNLPDNIRYFGKDALFLAGTGIAKHQDGIRGGVRAMQEQRQALSSRLGSEKNTDERR